MHIWRHKRRSPWRSVEEVRERGDECILKILQQVRRENIVNPGRKDGV